LVEADALDVLRLGPDGALLDDLPGWRALTGRATPLRGFDWWDDVHPADRAAISRAGLEHEAPGRLLSVALRLRAADGSYRNVVARMVGLVGAGDGVSEWIGRIEDITEEQAHRNRAIALAAATAALARTVTIEDVVGCVESVLLDVLDASACAVFSLEEGGASSPLLLSRNYPGSGLADPSQGPADGDGCRIVVPLRSGTTQLGSWHLLLRSEPLVAAHRDLLETVGAQLAQALSRARLLEHSLSTARLLQRALLPDRLPPVPGLEVAARYRYASGSDVGGDWYDVLNLTGGTVGLVLGDVMGRGVRAASTMGQVRNALRGIAVVDPTPVGMLTGLDSFFTAFDPDEITTLVITVIDTRTGALHVGNAGHLPPLLLRADGRSGQLDDGASTPLGVPTERVACKGTTLLPGDLLLMCSDGLIERREWSLSYGLAILQSVARRLADQRMPLEEMADALLREVLEGAPTDDDVSLLLIRVPD
jgi:serine phosphatase RsbU (regulator of sigma subunit)